MLQLVGQSIAGKTHEELESQLRLRVYNTLLDLVRSGKLVREAFEGVFVYLSIRGDRAEHQLTYRREGAGDSAHDILPDGLVIEALAEIIRTNRVDIDQSAILKQLAAKGIEINASQFNQLCTRLDLKKHWVFCREIITPTYSSRRFQSLNKKEVAERVQNALDS